ncbi:MAG: efflux RND transporter periplasmic adaptor subunit [Crocinitomicaceae bacterium]
MKQVVLVSSLIFIVISCGSGTESNPALDDLIASRDSAKAVITALNEKIAALDTTTKKLDLLVTSEMVEVKPFSHKVELQGQIETDQNIMLNAEANGVIKSVRVKEGQRVSRGQTLVIIDSEIISTSIAEVNNSLELATFMYNKQLSLSEKGLGTEIELEQAKNQKGALEAKLRSLNVQKSKTVVTAPFSGIVDQIFTHTGEMASPMTPLIRLVNNSNMKISASVSENYLGQMQVGTPVEVTFPTIGNYKINSAISYLGNYIDEVNRTFRVQVKVDQQKDVKLLPNQLVKVNITDFALDSAKVISKNAILQNTDNQNYVYVLTKAENELYSVEQVFIEVLSTFRGKSAIEALETNKLMDGSRIVLNGGKGITANDKVKVQ